MAKNPQKRHKIAYKKKLRFFSKIGLRHFSSLTSEQLHAKNLKKSYGGKYENFALWTDGLTDGLTGLDSQDPCAGPKNNYNQSRDVLQ